MDIPLQQQLLQIFRAEAAKESHWKSENFNLHESWLTLYINSIFRFIWTKAGSELSKLD